MKKVIFLLLYLGYIFTVQAQIYAPEIKVQETGGFVGINKDNPQATLDVNGFIKIPAASSNESSSPGITYLPTHKFTSNNTYLYHYGLGFYVPSTGSMNLYLSGYYGLDFFSEGQNRMHISRKGNIGIGTVNPPSILSINSTNMHINTSSTYQRFSSNDDVFTLQSPSNKPIVNLISGFTDAQNGANLGGIWWTRTKGQSDAHRQVAGIYAKQYGTNLPGGEVYLAAKKQGTGSVRTMRFDGEGRLWVQSTQVWPDYVFEHSHSLPSLSEIEKYINDHKHLPGIPSEIEVKEFGIDLASMDAKLLQKIEELTLYVIEQNKKIEKLEQRLQELQIK